MNQLGAIFVCAISLYGVDAFAMVGALATYPLCCHKFACTSALNNRS